MSSNDVYILWAYVAVWAFGTSLGIIGFFALLDLFTKGD